MPGTQVHDANAANLLTGATINSAATTQGTPVQVDRPGDCAAVLKTATVTGTSPTISVTIQSSDDATFASGVIGHGTFGISTGTAAAQSNVEKKLMVYITKRYARAVVTTAGTSPVYTGATVKLEQKYVNQNADTSAS